MSDSISSTSTSTERLSMAQKLNKAFSYAEEEDNDTLGKDTFLQLMISKMSNQDPLDPTDDTEFLSQLAQYTSLEQMMNMSEAMTRQQGFDMVGKYVIVSNNGSYYTGRVDSVIYDGGEISLDVGGVVVSMDAVKEILAEAYTSTDTDISEDTAEAE